MGTPDALKFSTRTPQSAEKSFKSFFRFLPRKETNGKLKKKFFWSFCLQNLLEMSKNWFCSDLRGLEVAFVTKTSSHSLNDAVLHPRKSFIQHFKLIRIFFANLYHILRFFLQNSFKIMIKWCSIDFWGRSAKQLLPWDRQLVNNSSPKPPKSLQNHFSLLF